MNFSRGTTSKPLHYLRNAIAEIKRKPEKKKRKMDDSEDEQDQEHDE